MKEKYSYSKLDTYDGCPFKFKLKYIDKNFFYSSNLATEYGTLIHGIEEDIANLIKAKQPIDYIELKNKVILGTAELEHKYPADYKAVDKSERTYAQKTNEYLESGIYRLENFMKEHPTYEIVGAEQKFEFDFIDKVYFGGSIDRIIKDTATGNYLVQDIKTWPEPKDQKELVTPLQFVTYTMGVKELYGVSSEQVKCQYDLPLCNLTQDAGTKGFMNRGYDKIKKLLTNIENQDYEPAPSPLCHWCEFCQTNPNAPEEGKMMCPYFMHWTKDKKDFSKENEWHGMENHQSILEAYHQKYGKKE